MRKNEITAAPWRVKTKPGRLKDSIDRFMVVGMDGRCEVCRSDLLASGEIPEKTANFNLMAAAPDLLEACQSMLRTTGGSQYWNGETHESLKLIEAAIAKATGETP